MNEADMLTNIKTLLTSQNWSGGTSVFPTGSVFISADGPTAIVQALNYGARTPIGIVVPTSAESDPEFDEEPDFQRWLISVYYAVVVPAGAVGEEPVIGANKTGGTTASEGRGLVEIEQQVYSAIGKIGTGDVAGLLTFRERGEGAIALKNPSMYIAYRVLTFEGWGTTV